MVSRMKGLVWPLALGGFFALGCGSGQTGSASCAAPQACPCERVAGQYLAKATVLDLGTSTEPGTSSTTASVEIAQVLNEDAAFDADDVQRRFSGHTFFPACVAKTDTLRVGDSVLVTFNADRYRAGVCAGYAECLTEAHCSPYATDYSTCADRCVAACVPDRSADATSVDMVLTLWAEAIEVGNGSMLAISDAVEISNAQTCAERYPSPPVHCNDMPDENCALSSASAHTQTRLPWLIATLLSGLFVHRSRRCVRIVR
jgi:hypothetical protein